MMFKTNTLSESSSTDLSRSLTSPTVSVESTTQVETRWCDQLPRPLIFSYSLS